MRRKNDILLKSAFEEAFSDFLRFFFTQADMLFDIERGFEFMDKELGELFPELEKQGGSRFVDMLAKTWLRDGTKEWVLVYLEIQADNTVGFSHRMFQYWYRIYDRYGVNIVALAVLTGRNRQQTPNYYRKSFLGTEITYKYNVYHILDHTEEQLLAMHSPFALIILAAQKALLLGKIPEKELAEQRLTIAKALVQSNRYDNEQIRRSLYFLKTFVYIEDPDINRKFDQHIALLTGNQTAMGIIETINRLTREEALEEGYEQKSAEVVKNLLLTQRFTDTEIASFAAVTDEFVKKIKRESNQ